MKKLFFVITIISLIFIAACNRNESATLPSEPANSPNESSVAEEPLPISPADTTPPSQAASSSEAPAQDEVHEQAVKMYDTAKFALGTNWEHPQEMRVGDTIGTWKLEELERSDFSITAIFSGETTLDGILTRNPFSGEGFAFFVDYEEREKMPEFVYEELGLPSVPGEIFFFWVGTLDNLEAEVNIADDDFEEHKCRVTIDKYDYTARESGPLGSVGNVTMLEML